MLGSLVLIFIVKVCLPDQTESFFETYNVVFWLETVLIVAFGISWLVKGKAIRRWYSKHKERKAQNP